MEPLTSEHFVLRVGRAKIEAYDEHVRRHGDVARFELANDAACSE